MFFPNFFAFQAREMKFGEQISETFLFIGSNFSQNFGGTWSSQILRGTRSFQILRGTRSFSKKNKFFENSCTRVYGNWPKIEV